jgi:hypothetical protein
MAHTIFFSWQSDTPNPCGRSFIEAALKDALKDLTADSTLEPAIRDEGLTIDRDRRGVPGTPPIVDTIFRKIDRAACFLADMTFVATRFDGKGQSPNPNVLLEYGWALKSLSHSRILTVMNTAYGEPTAETLPFDMRHLSWPIAYHLPDGADAKEKAVQRKQLASSLKGAIRDVLASEEFQSTIPKPPAPAKFELRNPEAARFRLVNGELGLTDATWLLGGSHGIKLQPGPATWLRVMPALQTEKKWTVSQLKQFSTAAGGFLLPLGGGSFSSFGHIRADDGYGFTAILSEEGIAPAVAFVFTTGEIWTVNAYMLSVQPDIPYVEHWYLTAFVQYVRFLKDRLQISGPYQWIAGLEQTKGRPLTHGPAAPGKYYPFPKFGACTSESIISSGIYDGEMDIHLALVPFFELLYDRCGAPRSPHLNDVLKTLMGSQ